MKAYYNEFDPKAAAWLRELIRRGLIAAGEVDERSILEVEPDDLVGFTQCHFFAGIGGWSYALRLSGWPDDQPVWTGSPPCQPFSSAGQRKGKEDERHLAPHFAHLVDARRPPILFGEQVASAAVFGKVAKKTRETVEGTPEWAWFDDLQDRLEAAHYAVGVSDIPAAGVGAPHIRQRTFFGAVGLAQPDGGQRNGITDGEERRPDRAKARWDKGNGQSERSGADLGLADAQRSEQGSVGVSRFRETDGPEGQGEAAEPSGDCDGYGLADADSPRLQPWSQAAEAARQGCAAIADGGADWPSPTNGFWRDADWLFCRDGKWRPVKSGTFPLASRVPARVVRLRGYGNAIVPQAAAAFIESFVAALQE